MTLDERTATVLGWVKRGAWWCQEPKGLTGVCHTFLPTYSMGWAHVEEMLEWLRERCYLEIQFDQFSMVYVTARRGVAVGFLGCEHGTTLPEALAKIVVCVAEALETGEEATYREVEA